MTIASSAQADIDPSGCDEACPACTPGEEAMDALMAYNIGHMVAMEVYETLRDWDLAGRPDDSEPYCVQWAIVDDMENPVSAPYSAGYAHLARVEVELNNGSSARSLLNQERSVQRVGDAAEDSWDHHLVDGGCGSLVARYLVSPSALLDAMHRRISMSAVGRLILGS